MKKIRITIWGLVIVMACVAGFVIFGRHDTEDQTDKYNTYTVKSERSDSFTGVVQADEKHAVSDEVKSDDEVLASNNVSNGQEVTKGQVLFTFYRNMASEINSANLEIRQAQLTIQELNKTTDKNTDYQIELAKDQEALSDAQDKLNKLNLEQNRTVIAPIAGTYFKDTEGRSFIYGTPIIEGNVNEFSLDKIKLGKAVTVVKNDGEKTDGSYTAKDKIPYNTGAVSYYHFQVSTDDSLPYGMHVQIKNETRGYRIPKEAVKSGDTVYIVRNNKKHKRVLDLTKFNNDYYVKEGIKAGDKLVLF
ncbi:efflux RND transporter periplasmic adaptor subunit [Companilactobacillus hulinensis]|uniref:efflux RND transporter periplasmic adaptor subunit n=1 Tax=Companilactobacillus hulinensis TaxID=2486007 RepID=UPI000F775A95|nr:efflux RND transporter periplasmic adaptor subunit [Companilactobacillus hulinensis]